MRNSRTINVTGALRIAVESMKNKGQPSAADIAPRAQEIQTDLGATAVREFDALRAVGMAVRLALHIQRLPESVI